jgi:hypothetical protein
LPEVFSASAERSTTRAFVVGEASSPSGGFHAALFASGGPIDLNALVLEGSEWSLNAATGINASRQISGFGTFRGALMDSFLTPVPEPSSMALFGAGIGLLASWRMLATVNAVLATLQRRQPALAGALVIDPPAKKTRSGWAPGPFYASRLTLKDFG